MKRVTIQDVARACNVSPSTVSLILNKKGENFSKQTQDKVLETARRMNYLPNMLAVSLQAGTTKTIGVLVPDIQYSVYSAYIKQIEQHAFAHGYNTMVGSSNDRVSDEIFYINSFIQKHLNGIVLIKSGISQSASQELLLEELLDNTPIRIVKIDRDAESVKGPLLSVDYERGGYMGTKYLLDLGHRRIGFITESISTSSTQNKIKGIMKCLREHNVTPNARDFFDERSAHVSANKSYRYFENTDVTAIFALSDALALSFYHTARENKKKIPSDYSLLGFNNSIIGEYIDTPLSTIALPVGDIARDAVERIIRPSDKDGTANQKQENSYHYFRPELIIRQSTAPPNIPTYDRGLLIY